MSDPKYTQHEGTLRFDDDNIVDVGLEPDTENISVRLNGVEVTGGGSEDFYVDFSVDPQNPSGTIANKTVAQIAEAVTAGLRVVGRYQVYSNNVLDTVNYIPLTNIYLTEGNEYAVFQGLGSLVGNQISIWNYGVDSSGVTYEELLINLATQ